eukprot:239767-Prymnesium_polylepis.1
MRLWAHAACAPSPAVLRVTVALAFSCWVGGLSKRHLKRALASRAAAHHLAARSRRGFHLWRAAHFSVRPGPARRRRSHARRML